MFGSWTKGKTNVTDQKIKSAPQASESSEAAAVVDHDQALEPLARVLRSMGRHAFDLEELSEEEINKEFEDGLCMCWWVARFVKRIPRLKRGLVGVIGEA